MDYTSQYTMDDADYLKFERIKAEFEVDSMKIVWAGSRREYELSDRMARIVASDPCIPRTVEEVFRDFKGRRAGLIKALTTDVEDFYQQCGPEKENLCLYGFPSEQWEVNLPPENVPPELPEPALGINFARDGTQKKDWLSLVAVHSDAWLLSVAFFYGARFGFDKLDRKKLFTMINDLPTLFEIFTGNAKKPETDKSSASEAPAPPPEKETPSLPPPKKEVVEEPVSTPETKMSKPSIATSSEDRIFVPLSSIVKADIEDYLASSGKRAAETTSKARDSSTVTGTYYADIPHSQIRKITASRLLLSKQMIPHYYLTVDTCVDKLMGLRSQLNSLHEAFGGKRISVNDLVIKAAALALRKVPQCNSSWTDNYIRQYHNVNVNVAVQTENGLFVPVIRDADKKELSAIGEEVKQLAKKARDNSLKPEDYEGGTFTVSNLGGPFGIKQFCAIINPPQAGILAVGSAERRVIPGSGTNEFDFASFMSVTLSCDHRVIDGAIGAEWLKSFKGYIENPESMLL